MARTSAFQFKGAAPDLRDVGAKLNVRMVLEGSVRKAGERLRINAQLINTSDGYHVWSERYDRTMDDVFAVQDDIARAVVEQLKVTLLGAPTGPLVNRPTVSLGAYECYLKGRHAELSRYNALRASRYYEEALRHDPKYAAAYAGLANAAVMAGYLTLWSHSAALDKAVTAVGQALRLDADLSEAHDALARIRFWLEWKWPEADEVDPDFRTSS